MTDGELLALCRQGHETAFAELVGRYRHRLWSICFRVAGNREDAEEAVQDTLTSAWQNLHKFRGEAKVSTWLYRIAANASLAVVRKRKETIADFDVIELEDPAPSPPTGSPTSTPSAGPCPSFPRTSASRSCSASSPRCPTPTSPKTKASRSPPSRPASTGPAHN